jgi:hypothetical protein
MDSSCACQRDVSAGLGVVLGPGGTALTLCGAGLALASEVAGAAAGAGATRCCTGARGGAITCGGVCCTAAGVGAGDLTFAGFGSAGGGLGGCSMAGAGGAGGSGGAHATDTSSASGMLGLGLWLTPHTRVAPSSAWKPLETSQSRQLLVEANWCVLMSV